MQIVRGQDVFGNIAILKFDWEAKAKDKKRVALAFLKANPHVKTVLEKSDKFSGRLRTMKTKFIAGERTLEALYKENGCEFRLNVESCYFSPRLAAERRKIASFVKNGEDVLVLFGGVAPFAIVIAKHAKPRRVVSVELGRECSKYALQNVKRNKLSNVEIIQGDVNRVLPKMKEKFSRIVMARPNLKDSFLEVTFPLIRKGGIIHYYGFYPEKELGEMKKMIVKEAKNARRKIRIMKIERAGDIGAYKYRYRADLKVLN